MASSIGLLERDAVLADLAARATAAAGGHGRAVSLVAAAGMGKTSLLAALATTLEEGGLEVLTACAGDQERALPHAVTRALLEPALSDPGVRREVLRDAAAPAAAVLGSADAVPTPLQHAVYWTVANLASRRPLALLLDDAHECDDASAACLSYLARRAGDLPVLLVTAQRPRGQAVWPDGIAAVHRAGDELALEPLSDDGVTAFIAETLGPAEVSPAFAEGCARATGGNPFYLAELLRDLRRRGVDPAGPDLPDPTTLAPPAIVRSVLLRMAALGPDARVLATACAVLGDGCRLDHAASLAGIGLDAAARAADALSAGGVLAEHGTGLRFAHPILRTAVVTDIGEHQRARWHARAATVLEEAGAPAAVCAGHLLRTEPVGDPAVAEVLIAAGRQALAASSPAVAIELLRRAETEPPAPAQVGGLLFALGAAEAQLGDLCALDHLDAAVGLAETPDVAAARAMIFSELARKAGVVPLALDTLERVLADPGASEGNRLQAAAERYWVGRTDTTTYARVRDDRGDLDRALASPDPAVNRVAAAYLAADVAVTGPREAAHRHLDHVLAPPGLLRFVPLESGALVATLFSLTVLERHADHERLTTQVLAEAGRTGSSVAYVLATIYRGIELLPLGHVEAAESDVAAAMEHAAELGWPMGSPELPAVQIAARLWQGDVAGAAAVASSAPFDVTEPTTLPLGLLADARAQLALVQGDPATALEAARAAGRCAEGLGVRHPAALPWRRTAAAALRALGDRSAADRLAREELALARELGGPAIIAGSLCAVAAGLPASEALPLLTEAHELVDGGPVLVDRATTAYELGRALRRCGQISRARAHLAEALELLERSDGHLLAGLVREEIRVAGGRPRRTVVTGVGALTPAESRVVSLAAAGMTNGVIAQTLFVSRKTVEKHLASAYGKLQIAGRRELAALDLASLG